jgi:FHA domain
LDPSALARFATSCGAFAPLSIAIEYHDGVVAATGTLAQPFALVGRDAACDIALDSLELLPQTAFLQVVGGQVFVGDLGTPAGLRWHHGRHPYGWMYPLEPIQFGPFALRLLQPVSPHPAPFGATFHPLVPGPDVPLGLPPVEIAFVTGQADRDRWPVNRVVTFIGSAPDCKIHLAGDDIAPRHCYLLHLPDGLWVVDLTGRPAVRVNGQLTRFARLGEGDELQVGRFVMGVTYPYPSEDDGLICFDDVPRPAPKPTDQDSSTNSVHRPLDPSTAVRQPPRTDYDVDVPPPTLNEPAPADWSVEDDTDKIHRPGPRPLSAEEFALLVPVDERGVADSGAENLDSEPMVHE